MKNVIATGTGALFLAIIVNCSVSGVSAQPSLTQEPAEAEKLRRTSERAEKPRPRMGFVKTANFYLRDGKLVFGKLLSEDKNQVTIEQLDGSRVIVSTYSKRDIDTRTLRFKNVPEARYYAALGEYFYGRTWDFRDDPDDFIQAIRCYEKARQSILQTYGEDSEQVDEIDQKISQLEADRQVWIRQVQSRTRLKKLEFEAEIENRLAGLEDAVNAHRQQLDKVAEMTVGFEHLEKSVHEMNSYLSRQLAMLDDRTVSNRMLIDDFAYPRYYYRYYNPPYYYHKGRKPEDPNSHTERRRGRFGPGSD
jgi:hypothetical protein